MQECRKRPGGLKGEADKSNKTQLSQISNPSPAVVVVAAAAVVVVAAAAAGAKEVGVEAPPSDSGIECPAVCPWVSAVVVVRG